MIQTSRSFSILKIKKDTKIIDTFISNQESFLVIITSIGRIFKYSLSNKYTAPISKQAQGTLLTKLFPTEKIISCCSCAKNKNIIIATKKGKFFNINIDQIYNSYNAKLGYINEKIQIKNDSFFKIFSDEFYCDIETNKERLFRLDFTNIKFNKNNSEYQIDFFSFDKEEYINNIYCLRNLLD